MPVDKPSVRELLGFHLEAGVDVALDERPQNRFEVSSLTPLVAEVGDPRVASDAAKGAGDRRARAPLPPAPSLSRKAGGGRDVASAERGAAPPPPDAAVMEARAAAAHARTLDELRDALLRFQGCALRATATQLVFADGTPSAHVMFVGEAPGAEEDREGLPFVGRSGKLLDRMMTAIGLDRGGAYIANIVPWRPPGNRTPTPQEAAICLPFIRRQIELVNPDVLVCLGGPAAAALLGINEGITKARGRWFDYDTGTRTIGALATFHPAYLLRSPAAKRLAYRDFLAIKKALKG
jgi:DNA polymerase